MGDVWQAVMFLWVAVSIRTSCALRGTSVLYPLKISSPAARGIVIIACAGDFKRVVCSALEKQIIL